MDRSIYKIIRFLFVVILLTVLISQQSLFGFANTQNNSNAEANTKSQVVPGEYLVKFKDLPEGEFNTLSIGASSLLEEKKVLYGSDISLMKIKNGVFMPLSDMDFLEQLKKDPRVEHVEPNYYLYPMSDAPNDVYFNELWGLNNATNPGIDISILDAWDITLGSSDVIVAVIDSGVNYLHEDLSDNIDPRWRNFIDGHDPNDIYASGVDKHGTHVSGTIAAMRNNGVGIAGVAPNVKVLPLKIFHGSAGGTTADAIDAINYAKDMGVKISNNSWGGQTSNPGTLLSDAIKESGMLFIAAAGNEGINNDTNPKPVYPASYDLSNILAVASIDINGDIADNSNYGVNSVDIGAPGVSILSTCEAIYATGSGTSMATPHVSGVAALMYSIEPNLSPEEAIDIILKTGKPITSLEGKTKSGKMVDANAALLEVIDRSTDLSNIEISSGTIYPQFASDITDYSVLVDNNTETINIIPTLNYEESILSVNNKPHINGETIEILINDTVNTVEIEVSSAYHLGVKTYTFDIVKGLNIINDDFIVYPLNFTDEYDKPIIIISNNDTVRIKTYVRNNSQETQSPTMIISLYNEFNELVEVKIKSVPIEKNKKEELSIDFNPSKDIDNSFIKAFIWDELDTMKPLSKISVFP